jgi:hypothetical protein
MKKEISLALYFSLFFSATSAFSTTISSSGNTYEVDPLTSAENITPIELMHWCNSLENNDPAQTEHGVYEFQGDSLLSINPNAIHFLCTQDEIDCGDLSPQDVSSYQEQTLYLVIKQESLSERPSNMSSTSQENTSSAFDNQGSSVQKQTTDPHPIEDTTTRVIICVVARGAGLLAGGLIGNYIGMCLGLSFMATGALTLVGLVTGLAVGWVIGAHVADYFFY